MENNDTYSAHEALQDVRQAQTHVDDTVAGAGSPAWQMAACGWLLGLTTCTFPMEASVLKYVILLGALALILAISITAVRREQAAGVQSSMRRELRRRPGAMVALIALSVMSAAAMPIIDLTGSPEWYAVPVGIVQAVGFTVLALLLSASQRRGSTR